MPSSYHRNDEAETQVIMSLMKHVLEFYNMNLLIPGLKDQDIGTRNHAEAIYTVEPLITDTPNSGYLRNSRHHALYQLIFL